MKKNSLKRLAIFAVILSLASASLLSGTLAKYVTSAEGNATAAAAKWSFKAAGGNLATSSAAVSSVVSLDSLGILSSSSGPAIVANNKIAPGASGSLKWALDMRETEVKYKYTVSVKMNEAGSLPDNFQIKNSTGNYVSLDSNGTTWITIKTADVAANAPEADKITSGAVDWKWAFETSSADTNDPKDTLAGIKVSNGAITLKIEAVQLAE